MDLLNSMRRFCHLGEADPWWRICLFSPTTCTYLYVASGHLHGLLVIMLRFCHLGELVLSSHSAQVSMHFTSEFHVDSLINVLRFCLSQAASGVHCYMQGCCASVSFCCEGGYGQR